MVNFEILPGERTASATCPAGSVAVGGGYRVTGFPIDWQNPYVSADRPLIETDPFGVSTPVGWAVDIFNGSAGGFNISVQIWALCV
ncbi:MAG: hypothetical protein ACRDGD_00455 [Candidatus Limnocylindria bacterium]